NDTNAPNQCSVIKYTSAVAPPLLDPVAGAAQMTAQMPKDLPVAGKTSIDGVKVEFLKASGKDGTLKVWRDPVHHLVIRAVMVLPSKSAQTLIDLSGISFAKPDPALLAPPKNCHAIKGESNANGGHAEVPIGAPR
ncbi:MAG: hypothetical protein ACREE3_06810, partial [Stellaceae bacterium]